MATSVPAATGNDAREELRRAKDKSRPPASKKGGVVMRQKNNHSHRSSMRALLSPRALRFELTGVVAIVLILGKTVPAISSLLRQFSSFLFE